jgi:hypothetical protein
MAPRLNCRQEGAAGTPSTGDAGGESSANSTRFTAPATVFDPTDYGPMVNYAIWLMTATAFIFLALRMYCKTTRRRQLWWDDHFLMASWISLAVACSLTSRATVVGFGRHLPDGEFNEEELAALVNVSNVAGLFSILAALWSKTSFALTLLRISDGWKARVIWGIIGLMNVVMMVSGVLQFFAIDIRAKVGYYIFSTGECPPDDVNEAGQLTRLPSLLRCHGHHTVHHALEDHLEPQDDHVEEREARRHGGYEHGRLRWDHHVPQNPKAPVAPLREPPGERAACHIWRGRRRRHHHRRVHPRAAGPAPIPRTSTSAVQHQQQRYPPLAAKVFQLVDRAIRSLFPSDALTFNRKPAPLRHDRTTARPLDELGFASLLQLF